MSFRTYLGDRLRNLVTRLGTDLDKSTSNEYFLVPLTPEQIDHAYRSSWLPRKIIEIPALDATRKWRSWNADAAQISALEAEERRLKLKQSVRRALVKARAFGGSAIYISIRGDNDPEQPLDPELVRRYGIEFLTVLNRDELGPGNPQADPLLPDYNLPEFYTLNNGPRVHRSRFVFFAGAEVLDERFNGQGYEDWGDSVLQSAYDACTAADQTVANIASLVFELKVDVIQIPDFMRDVGDEGYREKIQERVRLAQLVKGNMAALLMDSKEDYHQKQLNSSGWPDLISTFIQVCAGAADIPMTRLLGQSPAGMNSTGESDMRNYYDRVQATQELQIGPAMEALDECLIRSALGSRPDEVFPTWNSLWQMDETDRAEVNLKATQAIQNIANTALIPDQPLAESAVNMLTELGAMPGLEGRVQDYLGGRDLDDLDETDENGQPLPETNDDDPRQVADAQPRTLYVSRPVLNAEEIRAWAESQGITDVIPAEDMHVTIAYSREPIDWIKIQESWNQNEDGTFDIEPGGPRLVEPLGDRDQYTVLMFASSALSYRHEEIKMAGASWDWPEYQPHISLSKEPQALDIRAIEPYNGRIRLGPEQFEEVRE